MSLYRRILLVMTKVQAHAAMYRAMALAQASGASLHVLGIHTLTEPGLPEPGQQVSEPSAAFAHFSAGLKALLDEQAPAGLHTTSEALETSKARDLVPACIARFAPDLVIKGLPASPVPGLNDKFSVDHVLLHTSQVPLLLVPAEARAMPANILVAVDVAKADLAQQALNHALVEAGRQLASACNGQVHLLSAYDLPLAILANPDLAAPWAEQVRESLQLPFDELADTHGVPYAQRYFIEGAPLRVIQSLVPTLKIDVVVVGVVQPRRWAKLIGDTTQRLVNHAPCSILTVRPPSAD
ncbi:universal stress protein [Pseudomonas putida]|uniref:universal stress protein n=1 Tax=Pseudomonas putida TaxID=303 RepID=UPI002AC63B9F|nr:universal stress protein [Pseudomonas putida]MDZ5111488.1 universal stress protein [Pseudomonas putida]